LARKDYKTDVELKFYCFHERTVNQFYHCFTTARFDYQISTVVVEEERRGGGKEGRSGEKGEKGEKEEDYGFGEISIEDSVVDLVPDAPG
jgi:1,4-dihydroxy-2-naphthoyl-CoA synthase